MTRVCEYLPHVPMMRSFAFAMKRPHFRVVELLTLAHTHVTESVVENTHTHTPQLPPFHSTHSSANVCFLPGTRQSKQIAVIANALRAFVHSHDDA